MNIGLLREIVCEVFRRMPGDLLALRLQGEEVVLKVFQGGEGEVPDGSVYHGERPAAGSYRSRESPQGIRLEEYIV